MELDLKMEVGGVSPDGDPFVESQPPEPSPDDNKETAPPKKQNVRKRTKTGCLTCRKRRIKCDEGKPTCNNCIKSKRHCEGYNQRVVFKEPMGAFHHGGPYGPIVYQPEPSEVLVNAQLAAAQSKPSSSQGPLPIIAPKPPHLDFASAGLIHHGLPIYPRQQRSVSNPSLDLNPGAYGQPVYPPFLSPTSPVTGPRPSYSQHDVLNHRRPSFHGTGELTSDALPEQLITPTSQQSHFIQQEEPPSASNTDGKRRAWDARVEEDDDYWYSDDDASLPDSGDELPPETHANHLASNDQGIMVARRLDGPLDVFGTQMRTFSAFADDNVLATYLPSSANSPLNDTQTAAIFWHFVNVTAPSMSLYERHPFDPTPMFQGQPVLKNRQNIWTYTLPIIALHHPALLHAMLALASLQMAKVQKVPAMASMKHYHLSLRRVAKNYTSPTRRTQPATLAATLLLGFYEVWNSDHDKWCRHMWGARAILKEVALGEMTREVLAVQREQRRERSQHTQYQENYEPFTPQDQHPQDDLDGISTMLLTQISGRPVSYHEPGYVSEGTSWKAPKEYTDRDMETFGLLKDLFWWYCKMDVYQSFLGGTRLLMDYDLWTQCPPRAPISRMDAIYGTFDHLILLLGRLANFASKDVARKKKAKKPDSSGRPPGGHSPPTFPGMLPSRGEFTIPPGFSPPRDSSPQSDSVEEMDLETSTNTALREWDNIRQAFEIFRAQLGSDFDALAPEYLQPMATPFGPAMTYRTYSIAGIWMNFYMGMTVLYRSHPSMPPVAMIAAGMAARQTAPFAIEIGRIAAGLIQEDCSLVNEISTLVGAAFIESSFPLFVAGVQYQTVEQRHWLVKRMHDVGRLTGWQSARQIAGGCEAAWMKAAIMGRGPPYQPPPGLVVEVPQSVWTRPRRIDERIRELEDDNSKVVLGTSERPKYALGLLSMEDDLRKLDLRED